MRRRSPLGVSDEVERPARMEIVLNLQRSDDELRLEMQQIESAGRVDGKHSPNPFAAALGIVGIVAIVALVSLVGRSIETFVDLVRLAADRARFHFRSSDSAQWFGETAPHPGVKAGLGFAVALLLLFAFGFLLRRRPRGRSE